MKNKVAPPFTEVEFDIMYDEGISKIGSLLDLGLTAAQVSAKPYWRLGVSNLAHGEPDKS